VGELVVDGPQLFQGYHGQPQATRAAFVEIEGRRMFRTGDLARVDEDGYFFMVDRLKRMINASGFKVWPAEVENLLFGHPGIQEACVVGSRDPHRGETVKAFVVAKAGTVLAPDEVSAWAREHMAAYKVPQVVEVVESLPKSATGKVQWRALQERELGQTS
jgi:fatty-acyl-CoA synthase